MGSWMEISQVLHFAAVICLTAVIILLVPALIDYLYRWRENRRIYSAMQGKIHSTSDADSPRVEQILTSKKAMPVDTLGWSPENHAGRRSGNVESASSPNREKTVLIADDDPVVVQALARRLQHIGFQVFRSPDAVHALMGAMKTPVDLIILDINMPSGNGLAVCEMLNSDPRYAKIPVIIHSVFGDEATKNRSESLGAYHVEKSPQSWNQIKEIVDSLFGPTPDASLPEEEVEKTPAAAAAEPPRETIEKTDQASAAGGPSPAPAVPIAPMCGSARVLCLESPPNRLMSVEHQLKAIAIDVIRLSDFEEGFWTCFTEKPHVVIVQSSDNPKKAQDLLQRFSEHPVTRSLPIFLIDDGGILDAKKLYSSMNLTVLEYPVDWKDLLNKLESHLKLFDLGVNDPLAIGGTEALLADVSPALQQDATDHVPLKILCIDDDPLVTKSIAMRLQPYGIKVQVSTNGTQGFLMAVKELPDLILLDMKMPNGEGDYVLSKLKENDRTQYIPVIVLTVETHPGIRRKMLAAGAAAFLSKPVRWPELFEEMSKNIELPERMMRDYQLTGTLAYS